MAGTAVVDWVSDGERLLSRESGKHPVNSRRFSLSDGGERAQMVGAHMGVNR